MRQTTPVRLGPLALLLSVISICLTILAVLSYTTAGADMRLAERYAQTVGTRYELERKGQQKLQELSDRGPESGSYEEQIVSEDGLASLQIRAERGPDGLRILEWRFAHAWEEDTDVDGLWPGK